MHFLCNVRKNLYKVTSEVATQRSLGPLVGYINDDIFRDSYAGGVGGLAVNCNSDCET
jgi:hypothetical protein